MTAKQKILDRLSKSPCPLAVHELGIIGISENAAASRLPELARAGKVIGTYRPGKPFKEWQLVRPSIFKYEPNGQMIFA